MGEPADCRRLVLTRDGQRQPFDLTELYASGRGDLLHDQDVSFVPEDQFNRVFDMGKPVKQTANQRAKGTYCQDSTN